jgi:hypothetical protein
MTYGLSQLLVIEVWYDMAPVNPKPFPHYDHSPSKNTVCFSGAFGSSPAVPMTMNV